MKDSRIENLDTLRATAILMVLIFHATQSFASSIPLIWRFTKAGSFGVDLFFALSGFLIGSLFFKETNVNGKVDISRFILRRISRTVPPYFIALLLSYLAVYIVRKEPFDFGYLLFLQNYYHEVPFFFISWSLCVEEHFYLILPIALTILLALFKQPSKTFIVLMVLISFIPLILRLNYQHIHPKPFGYYITATHLNFDPLILGVLFAYISIYFKVMINALLRYKAAIYVACIALLASYSWWPPQWMYSLGAYLLAVSFAATVALASADRAWVVSTYKLMGIIAVASYAIYLTHVLTLHSLERVFEFIGMNNIFLELSITLVLACLIGYIFYCIIEKPLMAWRKKAIPSYRTLNRERTYVDSKS